RVVDPHVDRRRDTADSAHPHTSASESRLSPTEGTTPGARTQPQARMHYTYCNIPESFNHCSFSTKSLHYNTMRHPTLHHLPPLYAHQALAIDDCLGRDDNVCYSGPTASGKSRCMLEVHVARPDGFLITPSLTILGGLLQKLTGADPSTLGQKEFEAL